VTSYSTLHQPLANTLHMLLTLGLYTDIKDIKKHVKYISFSDQKTCILLSYY